MRTAGMAALMLCGLLGGHLPMGDVEPEDIDGPPPPPGPPPGPPIDPHCSRKGCGNFGRWQPVLMLGSYDWAGQVPCELHMAVCDQHRAGFDTYCDGDGWRVICEAFAAQLGRGKRGPRRHLSGVEHVAVAPRFAPFSMEDVPVHSPSEWVSAVRSMADIMAPPVAVQWCLTHLRAEHVLGADGFQPAFCDEHRGSTLREWAWAAGVDLEGFVLVADAVDAGRLAGGTA